MRISEARLHIYNDTKNIAIQLKDSYFHFSYSLFKFMAQEKRIKKLNITKFSQKLNQPTEERN